MSNFNLILKAIINDLSSNLLVQKVVLYGSRARGDNSEKSDIDLAVSCPDASELDWLKIKEAVLDAKTLLLIDVVRLDSCSKQLKKNILIEGKVLYERDKN